MIRTVWVWCVGIILTIVFGVILILFSFLDPTGKVIHLLAQLWGRGILAASGVKVRVKGLENLPAQSPMILTSNHQGYFDIFALFVYIPVYFGWFAKKELFRIPIFGTAMKRFGNIRIDRSNREKAMQSLKLAARRVREGQSVIIFPEGTRSPDGKMLPFKKGCYYLAEASGAPMVPISISGSYEIMPKGTFKVNPGTIHMVIGRPILIEGEHQNNPNGFLQHLRETMINNQVTVT
jgi:1-acyl-sn-glycerol-3-phosphate acyltransferase